MAEGSAAEQQSPGAANDLNDLFDYDVGLDDILQDNGVTPNANTSKPPPADDPSGLGLDEEVKVTKKRQPVAKLDEGRLLSQPGIPKLRRTAKQKLRFKGKGHEFSDAARLLNFYQLWLDDLFPRAKFADGLAMIEKLGHSKRIQTMRREWIDEEKRKLFDNSADAPREIPQTCELHTENSTQTNEISAAATQEPLADGSDSRPRQDEQATNDPELFFSDHNAEGRPTVSLPEPEEDDLDDLLREEDEGQLSNVPRNHGRGSTLQDPDSGPGNYDAEYEAMKELGI